MFLLQEARQRLVPQNIRRQGFFRYRLSDAALPHLILSMRPRMRFVYSFSVAAVSAASAAFETPTMAGRNNRSCNA
jgi:hypothetical protein